MNATQRKEDLDVVQCMYMYVTDVKDEQPQNKINKLGNKTYIDVLF